MALRHGALPSSSTGESESASKLLGQGRRLQVKDLYCLVCSSKNPGGFPRGVGTTEIFPHAAKIYEWLQEIADMETCRYRCIEPVGSQLVYDSTSAVPQACHSEPTAPDVRGDIVRYYAVAHERWYSYLVNKVFITRRRGSRDPMSLLRMFTKVDPEGKISLPTNIQREMGMCEGQLLELKINGSGKRKTLVIVPRDHEQ